MKNKEKYDLNTLKIEWSPQIFKKRLFTVKLKSDKSTIFSKVMKSNEPGTSAYNAWLEEEYDPKILTEKEKAYLSAVIKPFRKRIKYIKKINYSSVNNDQFLCIALADDHCGLPNFKKGTMYKGMRTGERYTLEELGL